MNLTAALILAGSGALVVLALNALAVWHYWTDPACRAARARFALYGSESLAEPSTASK